MDEQAYYLQPQQSSNSGTQSQLSQQQQNQQQQQQQQSTQQQMNQQPQQQSQQQQGNTSNNTSNNPVSYTQNLSGYQNGGAHQMTHIPFHPQNHPAYLAAGSQHLIDYSQLPGNQTTQSNYSLPTHYAPQLHHGYAQQPDQYLSQSYQQPFDYDPSNQLNPLSYYAPQTGVNLTAADQSAQGAGNIIPSGLQAQSTYGQYPPPLLSSQQHYQLDPSAQSSTPYGQQQQQQQYHAHQVSHPVLDQASNYLQFGQSNTYPGGQNHPYLPFNATMQSIHNGQIHTHSPYGLLSNPNQIGLIDPSLQGRQQQPQQIGKASIKSEEQAMENELNMLNSLGDSQSQIEDKLKQNNGQFMVPQTYEQQQQQQQQQAYQYYALGPQHFQGYPTYSQGQIQPSLQQQVPSQQQQPISPLQAPGSANSLKDKDDKRQPNSPGRKKAIKKGSPTTEPSSPASPRGRKRKNTGKNGELEGISPTLKPSGLTLIQQSSQPVQSQTSGTQFGLHLMKVPSQPDPFDARKQQLGFVGNIQPNYGQLGIQNNLMLDPQGNMQQISNIDQSSLQRLKELPTDFNLSDFAGINDEEQSPRKRGSKRSRTTKRKGKKDRKIQFFIFFNQASFTMGWAKKISYDVRKKVADSRLRDKGRFVTKKQAMEMLQLSGREEEFTMDQLKEMLKQRGILQPTGGDEDSKSPTFQSKNCQQPRRLGSLKQGEEYEGREFDQEVRSEEQLPNDDMLVLNRGRSCEGNLLTSTSNNKNEFAGSNNSNISQNLQFFSEMVKNNNNNNLKGMDGNNNENGMMGSSENQLLLKLEQKENDNQNKPFKQQQQQQQASSQQQQQQQQQQLQQQPNAYRQFSQSPQSQSPLRSPNKQQNSNLPHKLIELIPTQQQQQQQPSQLQNIHASQEGIKSNSIIQQEILGNTNQNSNNFPIEASESPRSSNNLLSQEVADQFGNLNIKSPDQKHQKLISSNPQMISLAEQSGSINHFFGGQQQQQQQNYILHNGQPYSNVAGNSSNSSNTGYPIHQQQ